MLDRPRRLRFGRAIGTVSAILVLVVAASGCARTAESRSGKPVVVATTTVLADLVTNVGGDLVSVSSLVPKNADVHTFEPRPSDIRAVAGAQLLVMNGLGLDDWLEKTITNAAAGGTPLVKLGVDLPGVTLLAGETASTENPHLWMDVKYAELYVDRIASALASVDPAHAAAYRDQAAAYKGQLEELDSWVRTQIDTIAADERKLVTFHDAFPYYAREYGITIVGVAVQAPGQDPSVAYTTKLIDAIKKAGVKVIFSESQFPTRLIDQLASEAGCKVFANLYDGSLGDPPVTSYIALIRWDTTQLVRGFQ
jgi:manganese/iron transport system substrate-binding protein